MKYMPTEKRKRPLKVITPNNRFKGLDGKTYKITPKEQIFCEVWLETVNKTISALEAYEIKNKLLCKIRWSELGERDKIKRRKAEATAVVIGINKLRNVRIKAYLDMRLADAGWVGKEVWKEHYKNIRQEKNLSAKNTAIDMFYKAGGKYKGDEGGYKEEIEAFFRGIKELVKK